jgi:cation:H+ antiporter
MEYIYLIAGFVLLLFGGKYLIKAGVALADRFNVSALVIGLTVVSFGTSAPELFVSVFAAINNHPEVAIGNVIGSNIANIALVLAITALIFPMPVKSASVKVNAPFMILVSVLLWLLMLNGILGRIEGIVLVTLLILSTIGLIHFSRKKELKIAEERNIEKMRLGMIILLLILATSGLAFGSDLLVANASIIAGRLGISERVIAITVVAFGTSLPELATSAIAAFKKEMDISIGNIIGSNVFNILSVLGITSLVKPIPVSEGFLSFDIFWMVGISVLLFLFILPVKGGILNRPKAFILFAGYCVYVYLLYFSSK